MSRFSAPTRPLGQLELVLLLATLMSLVAFSTDSTLPAMTDIAAELAPDNKSLTQFIVSVFLVGSGVGMLVFGPLSDSVGRRPTMLIGITLYVIASILAAMATSLEFLLIMRFFQGLGAAAARTNAQAVTRDLFAGTDQARISSLIFMFFVAVPALAPLIGQQVLFIAGWRAIFAVYVGFALFQFAWFMMRLPETLPAEKRRPLRLRPVIAALGDIRRSPVTVRYTLVQVLLYGPFLCYLSSAEQLWVDAIGVGHAFPLFFAGISVFSMASGFVNAKLVGRLGMRRMLLWAFGIQVVAASLTLALWMSPILDPNSTAALVVFFIWSATFFSMNGLTLGNVTALAMEPLGHIAGTATAAIGALSMVGAIFIAAPLGQMFDGTPRWVMGGAIVCAAAALALIRSDMNRARG